MADKYYIGANPADFFNAANWALTHGGAGGNAVANGDNLFVDYSVANIDGADGSAYTFGTVTISRGYGRPSSGENPVSDLRVGSAGGTPLKFNCATLKFDNDVVRTYFLYGAFTNIYADLLAAGSKVYLDGSGCTAIECGTNGEIQFATNCSVSRIESAGTAIKLDPYATLPPALEVNLARGAVCESRRRVCSGSIGGRLWLRDEASFGSVNQVETITMDAASTGGNLKLRVQKTDGTWATTGNIAWSGTDNTYISAINTALDAATGVAGGIVASATSGVDPDNGFTLTYSGTGYAGLSWQPASVAQFPTTSTAASYANVRAAGSKIAIDNGAVFKYNATSAIGTSSADIIRAKTGGVFDASEVKTPISLKAQIIASGGSYKLASSVTQTTTPRQPGGVMVG